MSSPEWHAQRADTLRHNSGQQNDKTATRMLAEAQVHATLALVELMLAAKGVGGPK